MMNFVEIDIDNPRFCIRYFVSIEQQTLLLSNGPAQRDLDPMNYLETLQKHFVKTIWDSHHYHL